QAFYTALPAGDYRFHVRGGVNGAEDSTAEWPLSIEPALYETPAFYVTSAMLVALAVWLAWWLRLRALHRRFELVLDERARIARELHDTVLQGMAGMALQIESVARRVEAAPARAAEDLKRLRRRLEQHIDEARQSIFVLRAQDADTRSLAGALQGAVDEVRADGAADV